jgi:uncharacterized protein YneF (UPF0154 family)
MNKAIYIVGVIVLVVIAAAGGFFAGTTYAQSQPSNNAAANFQRLRGANGGTPSAPGAGGQGGAFAQFGNFGNMVARGQIKTISGDSLQISTADKVVTVKVNDKTVISKTVQGILADLKEGDRVTVFSRESGDTPTASTIQLQGGPGQ